MTTPATKFTVQTVLAYATADGERFHSVEDAQLHTRKELYKALHARACRDNPEFARLDKDLLVDLLLHSGSYFAKAITNAFEPLPLAPPPAAQAQATAASTVTPMPAARPDASPAPTAATRLMDAAAKSLATVRGERADPGFPPSTTPAAREPVRKMVDEFDEEMDAAVAEVLARGAGRG